MKSPHPREEVEYQNVNKEKVCCLYVKEHLQVLISEHITDIWYAFFYINCMLHTHVCACKLIKNKLSMPIQTSVFLLMNSISNLLLMGRKTRIREEMSKRCVCE